MAPKLRNTVQSQIRNTKSNKLQITKYPKYESTNNKTFKIQIQVITAMPKQHKQNGSQRAHTCLTCGYEMKFRWCSSYGVWTALDGDQCRVCRAKQITHEMVLKYTSYDPDIKRNTTKIEHETHTSIILHREYGPFLTYSTESMSLTEEELYSKLRKRKPANHDGPMAKRIKTNHCPGKTNNSQENYMTTEELNSNLKKRELENQYFPHEKRIRTTTKAFTGQTNSSQGGWVGYMSGIREYK